jgi:hypothetical protein
MYYQLDVRLIGHDSSQANGKRIWNPLLSKSSRQENINSTEKPEVIGTIEAGLNYEKIAKV